MEPGRRRPRRGRPLARRRPRLPDGGSTAAPPGRPDLRLAHLTLGRPAVWAIASDVWRLKDGATPEGRTLDVTARPGAVPSVSAADAEVAPASGDSLSPQGRAGIVRDLVHVLGRHSRMVVSWPTRTRTRPLINPSSAASVRPPAKPVPRRCTRRIRACSRVGRLVVDEVPGQGFLRPPSARARSGAGCVYARLGRRPGLRPSRRRHPSHVPFRGRSSCRRTASSRGLPAGPGSR